MNSSIQSISSQGKYHFTFSYHQIMNSNRAPKQWPLTKNETITTFEAWRQNQQYSLSLDGNFAPFLAETFTWLKKSSTAPTRGLEFDGNDVPTTCRRTAFQKNLHLDLMLGQIANFCPVISGSSIVKKFNFHQLRLASNKGPLWLPVYWWTLPGRFLHGRR